MAIEDAFGLNLATIAGAIGILTLLFWSQTSKQKKDKRKTLSFVWVIGVVVFLIGAFGNVGFLTNDLGQGTGTALAVSGGNQQSPSGFCAIEDTTVTLSAQDSYTTAATGGTHRYRVNNAPALTVSNAGTFTASPGDTINILWENGSSTSYYSDVDTVTVPCLGTTTFYSDLYQNGTLTVTVFNENKNAISSTTSETLAAGDVVSLDAELKGQYQRGYPYGGIIVAEYNNTAIDDVKVDFGGTSVSTPDFYTVSSTANIAKSYTIPTILSNQKLTGQILIDADDTQNPTPANNLTLTFYPYDYFINEDNGGAFEGPTVEDEDDAQTFSGGTAFTLYVD